MIYRICKYFHSKKVCCFSAVNDAVRDVVTQHSAATELLLSQPCVDTECHPEAWSEDKSLPLTTFHRDLMCCCLLYESQLMWYCRVEWKIHRTSSPWPRKNSSATVVFEQFETKLFFFGRMPLAMRNLL